MENNKGRYCRFCEQNVRNPCIHISQKRWCRAQPVDSLVGSIIYGHYESWENQELIECGIGPILIENGYKIEDENLITIRNGIDTRIRLSSCCA